jgi:hypothetical protein
MPPSPQTQSGRKLQLGPTPHELGGLWIARIVGMPEPRQSTSGNSRSVDSLVEHVRELPLADQFELLRKIAPAIIGDLDPDDRNELVADLNEVIAQRAQTTGAR